jgi:hypothetical protein
MTGSTQHSHHTATATPRQPTVSRSGDKEQTRQGTAARAPQQLPTQHSRAPPYLDAAGSVRGGRHRQLHDSHCVWQRVGCQHLGWCHHVDAHLGGRRGGGGQGVSSTQGTGRQGQAAQLQGKAAGCCTEHMQLYHDRKAAHRKTTKSSKQARLEGPRVQAACGQWRWLWALLPTHPAAPPTSCNLRRARRPATSSLAGTWYISMLSAGRRGIEGEGAKE